MRLARFAWIVLACNLLVILWGAVVRASGSGAGCGGHWPLCNGEVVPAAPTTQTLIEYSHRLTSGLAFLLVAALLIATLRSRAKGDPARRWAAWAMFFMVLEAAVGAGLVLFALVADNATMARALFMAVHLVNTFLLLAALALTAWWAQAQDSSPAARARISGRFLVGLAAALLTGVSGAVAALGDTLNPIRSIGEALAQDLSPTSHLLIRLRVFHPAIALVAAALFFFLGGRAAQKASGPIQRRIGLAVVALAATQLMVGLVNLALLAPIPLQLLHLLLADLLWIALVLLAAAHVMAKN